MGAKQKKSSRSEFITAILGSTLIHCAVIALGCINVFKPQPSKDMFLNIEIAGAAEMQQALDAYKEESLNEQKIPDQVEEIQKPSPEPIQEDQPTIPEQEPPQEKIEVDDSIKDQLVPGPSIIEQPEPEPIQTPPPAPEPIPEPEEELLPTEDALPKDLQQEQQKRIEEEKKLQEEKEAQEKLRIEEEKRRLEEKKKKEEKRKKKLREERLKKKKKEAARRKKKRLEVLKRIQKKKSRKKLLSKIAEAVKKNDESKKKIKNNAFDNMLKAEKKSFSSFKPNKINAGMSGFGNGLGSYGDGMGLTDSDAAIISSQIAPHWVVAGGVKNAETLIIRIRIKVKNNGEVPASSIEIIDKERYNSDKVFRSAADSAKRAILQASPLKIPADKMHLFRDFEFSFNTDKALGVKR